jgi:5-methylcytosine-specific restriction endonuclease McrA
VRSRATIHARSGPRALNGAPDTRRRATAREWALLRLAVLLRAHFRCQACGRRVPLDVHHVVKRSQGGSDFDLDRLVALCRRCHDLTDAPYRTGRLVITPLGNGTFECTRLWRASKWDGLNARPMPSAS